MFALACFVVSCLQCMSFFVDALLAESKEDQDLLTNADSHGRTLSLSLSLSLALSRALSRALSPSLSPLRVQALRVQALRRQVAKS